MVWQSRRTLERLDCRRYRANPRHHSKSVMSEGYEARCLQMCDRFHSSDVIAAEQRTRRASWRNHAWNAGAGLLFATRETAFESGMSSNRTPTASANQETADVTTTAARRRKRSSALQGPQVFTCPPSGSEVIVLYPVDRRPGVCSRDIDHRYAQRSIAVGILIALDTGDDRIAAILPREAQRPQSTTRSAKRPIRSTFCVTDDAACNGGVE